MKLKKLYQPALLTALLIVCAFDTRANTPLEIDPGKQPDVKLFGKNYCTCSGSFMYNGYEIHISVAYNAAPGYGCDAPSYCVPGGANDAYMFAWSPMQGQDYEFETSQVSGAAFNAICGPCYYAKTTPNN